MDETAWVIEYPPDENGLRYFGRTIEGLGPTYESLDAVRFCRQEDAEMIMVDLALPEAKAANHMWMDERVKDDTR